MLALFFPLIFFYLTENLVLQEGQTLEICLIASFMWSDPDLTFLDLLSPEMELICLALVKSLNCGSSVLGNIVFKTI